MDARIDVFAALGLELGEAHVLRNAGGRVTDDVLRSLALSSHALGVDTLVVMQHTRCGLHGVDGGELQATTGTQIDFLAIEDHAVSLREDIELLRSQAFLDPIRRIVGLVFDVETGAVTEELRWECSDS
jgi:carbonic anhydrase